MTLFVMDSTCATPENWGEMTITEAIGQIVVSNPDRAVSIGHLNSDGTAIIHLRDIGDGGIVERIAMYSKETGAGA